MPTEKKPKKQVSQRRKLQNQEAQRKYRERQKRHLELLEDISGYKKGLVVGPPQPGLDGSRAQELSLTTSPPHALADLSKPLEISNIYDSVAPGIIHPNGSGSGLPYQSFSSSAYPDLALFNADNENAGSAYPSPQPPNDLSSENRNGIIFQEYALIKRILLEEVLTDQDLRSRILENRTSVSDILKAGLKALSQNSSPPMDSYLSPPNAEEEEKDGRSTKLSTDKIILLKNMIREPAQCLPNIYKNNIRVKQLMYVAACVANAATLGLIFDSASCEDVESPFFRAKISEALATAACSKEFTELKPYLRPSSAQIIHPHHPYLDVLPFPVFRERVLRLISTDPPMIDEDELCEDLTKDGLICWGTTLGGTNEATGSGAPWDLRSWEAQPWFMKKWWILIGGKEGEIYQQTRWWYEMRGERFVHPW